MIRQTFLEVDIDKICQNAMYLKSLSENPFFCPMIKADAYGHGDKLIAKALQEKAVDFFGLALYEEAIELRKSHIEKSSMLVFAGLNKSAVEACEKHNLTPVISRLGDLQLLAQELTKPLAVHLKLNTNMQRLGIDRSQIQKALDILRNSPMIKLEGLCTHFANSEDVPQKNSTTLKAIADFADMLSLFPKVDFYHAYNSSALLLLSQQKSEYLHRYGARPGISLYGAWPDSNLQEAMTIKSSILQVHHLEKGQGLSYGHIWTAPKNSVIGVLPIGYADGLRRLLSEKLSAKVRGKNLPLIGRICMDYVFIDLTELITDEGLSSDSLIGDEVILLDANSKDNNTTAWANKLNTIPYEVMTSFTKRLIREYV